MPVGLTIHTPATIVRARRALTSQLGATSANDAIDALAGAGILLRDRPQTVTSAVSLQGAIAAALREVDCAHPRYAGAQEQAGALMATGAMQEWREALEKGPVTEPERTEQTPTQGQPISVKCTVKVPLGRPSEAAAILARVPEDARISFAASAGVPAVGGGGALEVTWTEERA